MGDHGAARFASDAVGDRLEALLPPGVTMGVVLGLVEGTLDPEEAARVAEAVEGVPELAAWIADARLDRVELTAFASDRQDAAGLGAVLAMGEGPELLENAFRAAGFKREPAKSSVSEGTVAAGVGGAARGGDELFEDAPARSVRGRGGPEQVVEVRGESRSLSVLATIGAVSGVLGGMAAVVTLVVVLSRDGGGVSGGPGGVLSGGVAMSEGSGGVSGGGSTPPEALETLAARRPEVSPGPGGGEGGFGRSASGRGGGFGEAGVDGIGGGDLGLADAEVSEAGADAVGEGIARAAGLASGGVLTEDGTALARESAARRGGAGDPGVTSADDGVVAGGAKAGARDEAGDPVTGRRLLPEEAAKLAREGRLEIHIVRDGRRRARFDLERSGVIDANGVTILALRETSDPQEEMRRSVLERLEKEGRSLTEEPFIYMCDLIPSPRRLERLVRSLRDETRSEVEFVEAAGVMEEPFGSETWLWTQEVRGGGVFGGRVRFPLILSIER